MELKFAIRKALEARGTSAAVEEFVEMFLVPFYKAIENDEISIKNTIDIFFNVDNRTFSFARARDKFKMPGYFVHNSDFYSERDGNRSVDKGKRMLIVYDSVDKVHKVEVRTEDRFDEFELSEEEFESIGGYLEVI